MSSAKDFKAGDYVAYDGKIAKLIEQATFHKHWVIEFRNKSLTSDDIVLARKDVHRDNLDINGLAALYPVGTKVSLDDRDYPNSSFIGGTVVAHDKKGFSIDIKHPRTTAIWIVYASDILDGSYKLTPYHE